MSSERFKVTQEQSVWVMHFALPGTLDTMEVDGLIESVLKQLQGKGADRWVVDLSEVQYMGSSMLGLFVNIRERIRQERGALVLCGMSQQLMRIFRTCCLERLFVISKSRGEAIALVARG
jgi:anti-sigma B factor antagonist